MKISVIGLLLFALAVSGFGQERYVRPVDEAKQDASFYAFRTRLIAAAEKHDAKFINSVLDPKIQLSFGGHAGLKDFKEMWAIEKPNSKFWDEFLPVIKNGGSFFKEGKTKIFYAPYTFNSFPSDLDGFEHFAIFGNNVNLRERPDAGSNIVDRLSYNVVKIENEATVMKPGNSDEADWYKVATLGGKTGYVKAEYVRSPIDYRAGFEKKRGQWKMVTFIAGD